MREKSKEKKKLFDSITDSTDLESGSIVTDVENQMNLEVKQLTDVDLNF